MKQALTEALVWYDSLPQKELRNEAPEVAVILAAARLVERLLPGECECMSKHPDERVSHRFLKTACHGSGQVWDEGIVEAVADVLIERRITHKDQLRTFTDAVATCREDARAVLSALVELLTKKVET